MATVTTEPANPPATTEPVTGSFLARTESFVRRHAIFLVVLAVGAGLRIAMHIAYPFAFWFPDSGAYLWGGLHWQWAPDVYRPFGYSLFLTPILPAPLIRIALAQHLIGLGLVALGYTFLIRRGVRPWLAALGLVPLAVHDLQLVLEHYVLSETLFTALVGGGLLLLLWRRRVSVVAAAGVGVLLAAATLTRSVGLPVIGLVFVYLLVKLLARQARWWTIPAYLLPVIALLAGYLVLFHNTHGVYAFDRLSGRSLYARAMSVADCDRLDLSADQRVLCDPLPASWPPEAIDWWVWSGDSVSNRYYGNPVAYDGFLRQFGMTVIKQQPFDYLGVVGKETAWHFLPRAPLWGASRCRFGDWRLPERPNTSCNATYATSAADQFPYASSRVPQPSTPLRWALARYSKVTSALHGPLLALAALVTLAAAAWRLRRGGRRDGADALLIGATGVGLILASVAFGMFEPRYSAPSVLLIPLACALALHRFGQMRRHRPVTEDNESGQRLDRQDPAATQQ